MPCVKYPDGSFSCRGGGFSVDIAADGAIKVKAGDWLSKYSMAIEGDFTHVSDFRHRRHQPSGNIHTSDLKVIENDNQINVGETLYHLPTREQWEPGFSPLPDPIDLRAVLARIKDPKTVCMVTKLFSLRNQPVSRWKANYVANYQITPLAQNIHRQYGDYDGSNDDLHFKTFNDNARNVFSWVEKPWSEDDLDRFVDLCLEESETIMEHLSLLRWVNSTTSNIMRPYGMYIAAYFRRMMLDKTTVLACYKDYYAPSGLI